MRDELRQAMRRAMTFNAPLSEGRATALVGALPIAPGHHVLDLGCGWAELLSRVVAAHPGATGTGVDLDHADLARGRILIAERGLTERVELVEGDVKRFDDRGAVVLCVGAGHAWGGSAEALGALREHVEPGGTLLFGDAFWAHPPSPRACAVIGDLCDRTALAAAARAAGFRIEEWDDSTRAEWDAFESATWHGLGSSGLEGAAALAAERRSDYEEGYRDALGFAWLRLTVGGDPA